MLAIFSGAVASLLFGCAGWLADDLAYEKTGSFFFGVGICAATITFVYGCFFSF